MKEPLHDDEATGLPSRMQCGSGEDLLKTLMRRVTPSKKVTALTKMPPASTCVSVMSSFEMATAAMAFMGCTGMGMPKTSPENML